MDSIKGRLSGLKKNPEESASYDSLLERDYMIELEQDPAIRSWTKKHGIKIPYTFLGLFTRNYLPDFLVEYNDGSKELHEGKGLPLLFWCSTKAKRAAAQEWCKARGMRYKVITRGKQIFYYNNFIENAGIKDSNNFQEKL
ncbi:MAG: hypothetical protein HYT21_03145 [Candidatus Nealsonbacteria bacterium]|nr:hypothetical protein [Candidatus Nealsonbacteria bacterium]